MRVGTSLQVLLPRLGPLLTAIGITTNAS